MVNSPPKWDGIDRIEELARCFTEVPSDSRGLSLYRKLQLFLSRAILRWGSGLQCPVLTLISARQNIGKSTFIRWLGDAWAANKYYTPFSASPIDPTSKDSRLATSKVLLHELSELGGLSKRDAQDVKSFLTAETFEDRKPYGHCSQEYIPLTVFVASANQDDGIFSDVENRRFLVVNLLKIDREYQKIDRKQLLAQAKAIRNQDNRFLLAHCKKEFISLL